MTTASLITHSPTISHDCTPPTSLPKCNCKCSNNNGRQFHSVTAQSHTTYITTRRRLQTKYQQGASITVCLELRHSVSQTSLATLHQQYHYHSVTARACIARAALVAAAADRWPRRPVLYCGIHTSTPTPMGNFHEARAIPRIMQQTLVSCSQQWQRWWQPPTSMLRQAVVFHEDSASVLHRVCTALALCLVSARWQG